MAKSDNREYNGHKNWEYWNVALWLFNDEGLYGNVRQALRHNTKDDAARELVEYLPEKTADGAHYTFWTVRAALVGEV